jgi:hypothetical protein
MCAESLNLGKLSRCEVGERGEWLEESHQPCHFAIGAKQRESRSTSIERVVRGDKGLEGFTWRRGINEA